MKYFSLFDVRFGVRNKSDQYQTQRITNEELDIYINDAVDHAVSIIHPLNEQHFTKVSYIDLSAGVNLYTIPDEVKSLIDIDVSYDNGQTYTTMDEQSISKRNYSTNSSNPMSYSYYFLGEDIELMTQNPPSSTNGLRFVYVDEPDTLTDSDEFSFTLSSAARVSGVTTFQTSSAHGLSVGDLVTINGMTSTSFDGVFRVATVPSTTEITVSQESAKDETATVGDGLLHLRAHIFLPEGRTSRRIVEAYAARMVLLRDEKDTTAMDAEIMYLERKLKRVLNPRVRSRGKRIRIINRYTQYGSNRAYSTRSI